MMFIIQLFLFIRTKSKLIRICLAALMVGGVFQIFGTANRGGFLIWVFGLLYMLWIGRKAITLRRVVIGLPMILMLALVIDLVTAKYGHYVTLWLRLIGTRLERGVPANRIVVWTNVLREVPSSLWLGHGPFYDIRGGPSVGGRGWPHNAYLWYLWTTGVVGLSVFIWILLKSIIKSFPGGNLNLAKIPFSRGVLVVAHVQILQFAFAQLRDEHQRGNVYPFLMWTFFGLAAAASRIWRESEESQEEEAEASGDEPLRPG
jgi:hypothetical protein